MPKDDWAKIASKERGKRAKRSGEYYRCNGGGRKKKKRKPKTRSKKRQANYRARMLFGKYKGRAIATLPLAYLRFLISDNLLKPDQVLLAQQAIDETEQLKLDGLVHFGQKYRGKPWSEVGRSYLLWGSETSGELQDYCVAELQRRGVDAPEIERREGLEIHV